MMDFEKLSKEVEKLEKAAGVLIGIQKKSPDAATLQSSRDAMRAFMQVSRDILMMFLKDRKEPIRVGHLFRDAAAKNIVPGDAADRGDSLLNRWGGQVTPNDPKQVQDDAAKLSDLASKLIPVLKAYQK